MLQSEGAAQPSSDATVAAHGAPGVTVSFRVRSSSSASTSETTGRVAAFQMMSPTTRKTTMISGATCAWNRRPSGLSQGRDAAVQHGNVARGRQHWGILLFLMALMMLTPSMTRVMAAKPCA